MSNNIRSRAPKSTVWRQEYRSTAARSKSLKSHVDNELASFLSSSHATARGELGSNPTHAAPLTAGRGNRRVALAAVSTLLVLPAVIGHGGLAPAPALPVFTSRKRLDGQGLTPSVSPTASRPSSARTPAPSVDIFRRAGQVAIFESSGGTSAEIAQLAAAGSAGYQINAYSGLSANKARVLGALQGIGASTDEQAIIIAMCMQETNNMEASQHATDKGGSATNYSALNVSGGMLQWLGYAGEPSTLNDQPQLGTVAALVLQGMRTHGVANVLNYQRGGQSGYLQTDGNAYDETGYRNAIGTSTRLIRNDNTFLTDDRRIEIPLGGV